MTNPYQPPAAELDLAEAPPARSPARDGPTGIGGWLWLSLLGLVVSLIRLALLMLHDIVPIYTDGHWEALTTPGRAPYHPLWASLIVFETLANLTLVVLGLATLWMFLSKSRRTPRLVIAWFVAGALVLIVDMILGQFIPAVANAQDPESWTVLVRTLISAAIWIPYFLRSVRVQNTFVN